MIHLDCNEIIPGRLWVGAYLLPKDASALSRAGITTVISLQSEDDISTYGLSLQELGGALQTAGIQLVHIPVQDFSREAIERRLPEAVAELRKALQPAAARVYLHCTAGINRAPTTAAAYLIRFQGMIARDACAVLTARRHCSPYLDVLERYASTLAPGTAQSSPEASGR
jgi:protein-tyrosine phosphatase